jgi:hypothetical protein
MWIDALLVVSSSVAYTGTPSCVQYLFMLLRRRLLAFALVGPVVELASGVPKPKNPTDSCEEEETCETSLELSEGAGARDLSGRETLTVVPRPLLLRT